MCIDFGYPQLGMFNKERLILLLNEKLKTLPRTNSSGNIAVTGQQVSDLHQAVINAERTKEITRALVDFSRYYA